MAKATNLEKGDRVRWGTSQGKTTGKVVRIMTKPFSIKGTDLKASKDDPKVVVKSEKTGAEAGHKPSALKKLKATAKGSGGKGKDGKGKGGRDKDGRDDERGRSGKTKKKRG